MNRTGRWLALLAVLGAGVLALVGVGRVVARQGANSFGPIVDLAEGKDVEQGKVDAKKAEEVKKKFAGVDEIMDLYKPRVAGGLGVGPARKGDGIELKLIALGKRPLAPALLQRESADLIKVARLNVAMAELTKLYPVPKKAGKGVKDWNKHADAVNKASQELARAARKNDPAGVRKAADDIVNACNKCHDDFR